MRKSIVVLIVSASFLSLGGVEARGDFAICTALNGQDYPVIYDGVVVWRDFRSGSSDDIYGYHVSDRAEPEFANGVFVGNVMAQLVRITGVQKVLANLRKAEGLYGRALAVGLKRGGLFLQRESQKIVPIELGHLKGGAFTRALGVGVKTDVIVGYAAGYAVYVHEDLQARHKKGKTAKYLEIPARTKRREIMQEIVNGFRMSK